MRKFQGETWKPGTKAQKMDSGGAMGGAKASTPYGNADEQAAALAAAMRQIFGVTQASPRTPPFVPGQTPSTIPSRTPQPGARPGLSGNMIGSIAMGGLSGLGGKAGIGAALAMSGMNALRDILKARRAGKPVSTPSGLYPQNPDDQDADTLSLRKGGKVKMKGKTQNTKKPQIPKKMASGGMTKKKSC